MSIVPGPSPEKVRSELDRILSSPPFARGEKLAKFLRFIVEETLAERSGGLKEYSIGIAVYERRPDYDTRTDATVRVEAGRLRTKLIEFYASPAGAASTLKIELPKGSYVPRWETAEDRRKPARRGFWGLALLAPAAGLWYLGRTGRPRQATTKPEAAAAYLEGRRLLSTAPLHQAEPTQWPPHIAAALSQFEKAVRLDPRFAEAHAGLATTLNALAQWDSAQSESLATRAKFSAHQALERNAELPEAHRLLGEMALHREWDLRRAAEHLERATRLDPKDARAQRLYASALSLLGRHDDAIAEAARGQLKSPEDSAMTACLSEAYFLARRHTEGRKQAERAIALQPDNALARWLIGINAQLSGDHAAAEAEYQECLRRYVLDARPIIALAHLRAVQGRKAEAESVLGDAIRRWGSERGWNCGKALVLAALHDTETARSALAKGVELREGSALYMLADPRFDPLRNTPEYQGFLRMVTR